MEGILDGVLLLDESIKTGIGQCVVSLVKSQAISNEREHLRHFVQSRCRPLSTGDMRRLYNLGECIMDRVPHFNRDIRINVFETRERNLLKDCEPILWY